MKRLMISSLTAVALLRRISGGGFSRPVPIQMASE